MKAGLIIAVVVILCMASVSANAAGEWAWVVNANRTTGNLTFVGLQGSSTPITFTGVVYNNDQHGNVMSFDGLTLKTDELHPNDPALFDRLFSLDASVTEPGSYFIDSMKSQQITIGTFNLALASRGEYRFKLTGAASYDMVNANPDQIDSGFITVEVVPEPGSATALAAMVFGLVGWRKRRLPR
jgi:hypothetical protein